MDEKREYAEIDYNKLAEAIVKENYKVEEEKQQHNTLDKGLTKLTKALFMSDYFTISWWFTLLQKQVGIEATISN